MGWQKPGVGEVKTNNASPKPPLRQFMQLLFFFFLKENVALKKILLFSAPIIFGLLFVRTINAHIL